MFIQELSKYLVNSDINITFSKNGDVITAIVLPKAKNDKISTLNPIVAKGTALQLDNGLLSSLQTVFTAINDFTVAGVSEAVEAIKSDEETAAKPAKVKAEKVVAPKVEKVNPKSVFEQATAWFGEGKYSEALLLYKEAVELKPDSKPYKESLVLCQRWVDSVGKMNTGEPDPLKQEASMMEEGMLNAEEEHKMEEAKADIAHEEAAQAAHAMHEIEQDEDDFSI